MGVDKDIADIMACIAKAETDSDRWRSAGRQEKYLESYFLVDALGMQLDKMRQRGVASSLRSERAAEDSPPSAAQAPPQSVVSERERLMAELSITFAGQQYQYSHYRYDRLDDAVAYARRQRVAPSDCDAADSLPPARVVEAPDALQRKRMARHGITFEAGVYSLGPYRYDRLDDALRYARIGEPLRFPIFSLS